MAFAGTSGAGIVVDTLEITNESEVYRVSFDVVVIADPVRARALLTDYSQWPRLSETITESQLIETFPDGRQRVSVAFRACILFIFCKVIRQVKDMETGRERAIYRTEIIRQGDFASGRETWEILARGSNETRLKYDATLAIAFRMPPLIGPWLLKRQLERELIGTAAKVQELLAQ